MAVLILIPSLSWDISMRTVRLFISFNCFSFSFVPGEGNVIHLISNYQYLVHARYLHLIILNYATPPPPFPSPLPTLPSSKFFFSIWTAMMIAMAFCLWNIFDITPIVIIALSYNETGLVIAWWIDRLSRYCLITCGVTVRWNERSTKQFVPFLIWSMFWVFFFHNS